MNEDGRRQWLVGAAGAALAVALPACNALRSAPGGDDDVAPPEDLMREHGALNRILLIYDESARRLEEAAALPVEALAKSADIIKRFIESYHEKLEEDFLFPRFEAKGTLVDLVAILRRQHAAGRVVTETVLRLATPTAIAGEGGRKELSHALRSFTRMYRPHEAREDTILFPAFRGVVTKKEFAELGDRFEDKEHELFGKAGFEGIVEQVGQLEQSFGLFDLSQFTPS